MDTAKEARRPKNLVKIPDSPFWYVRFTIRGREVMESTRTTDVRQAIQARNRIKEGALRAALGDRLGEFIEQKRGPVEYSRLAEVGRAYEDAAVVRGLAPISVIGALGSLRRVVEGAGHDWQTATAAVLSADTVDRYVAAKVAQDGTDSGRRSVRSTLNQARAVFARWAMELYGKRFRLPDLDGFRRAGRMGLGKVHEKVYQVPEAALLEKTKAAAAKLEGERRKAWLLCYGLAMRASEVANCRWEWFVEGPAGVNLQIIRRPYWTPKASERNIPVPANLWAELKQWKQAGDVPVLEGAVTRRLDTVERDLAEWMRELGWTTEHCAHELRAWKGSVWFTDLGPEVAREWLGHRNVATTCKHYARLVRQPKPIEEVL